MSKTNTASSIGLMAAAAASLCCITPLIALLAGTFGASASLSWLEPFRPYLIGLLVLALGFVWVQTLRTKVATSCAADGACTVGKKPFLASRTFLLLVTVATALIVSFPYYAKAFYPKPMSQSVVAVVSSKLQTATFSIQGMTSEGCEGHVKSALAKVPGVIQSVTDYAKRASVVRFDDTKTTVQQLKAAIDKTGYTVVATKREPYGNSN